MGKQKKGAAQPPPGHHAKERHRKDRRGNLIDWSQPLPAGLVARREEPKSKHHSYFEFVENTDKKKKLEFEVTTSRKPPPGFEFVPIGNPELTKACKEMSREADAMIFIVSTSSSSGHNQEMSLHLTRIGHHIRQTIVEQARISLGEDDELRIIVDPEKPEPIPRSQQDITAQADAAIKDLFPKIPNTDRQMILEHAFRKGATFGGVPVVGMAQDLTLSRRVQLAVLAHIRHNYTRYDQLLRETEYVFARKAVQPVCLDYIVKWRGDEETGRDQLDEILREVIVISDTESDEEGLLKDEESESDEADSQGETRRAPIRLPHEASPEPPAPTTDQRPRLAPPPGTHIRVRSTDSVQMLESKPSRKKKTKSKRKAKKGQRGFQRYQAVANQAWHDAVERHRQGDAAGNFQDQRPMRLTASAGTQPHQPAGTASIPGLENYTGSPATALPIRRSPDRDVRVHGGATFHPGRAQSAFQEHIAPGLPGSPADQVSRRGDVSVAAGGNAPFFRPIVGNDPERTPPERHTPTFSREPGALRDWLVPSIEPRSPGVPVYGGQGVSYLSQASAADGEFSLAGSRSQFPLSNHSNGSIASGAQEGSVPTFYDLTRAHGRRQGPFVSHTSPYLSKDQPPDDGFITLPPRVTQQAIRPYAEATHSIGFRRSARLAAQTGGPNPVEGASQPLPMQTDYARSVPDFVQVVDSSFPRRFVPAGGATTFDGPDAYGSRHVNQVQVERYAQPVYREVMGPGNTRRQERVVAVEYIQPSHSQNVRFTGPTQPASHHYPPAPPPRSNPGPDNIIYPS